MYLNMGVVFGCYGHHDRNLTVCPLFHGSGFNFCFATLFFGGTVVIASKFDPDMVVDRIASERITNASLVPTHLAAIFGLGERRLRSIDTSALRALISNGAPLALSLKQMGSSLWDGNVLFEAYGGTEAGVIATMPPSRLLERPTSVGEIFPGSLAELRDDAGNPVPCGEMGELYTRSPYLFSGYEGGNAPSVGGFDWFSAGDLGRFDAEGFLYLLDRKDEKIISGGINIYPSEVELAMADHPAVADVAVFGVPDAYWGEAVHALVSLAPGAGASAEELLMFAKGRIGRLKAPKTLEIRTALPKSAAGKVLRRVLRDEYRARSERQDGGECASPDSTGKAANVA
jgi:long-chain acyl-CoA synthetase